MGLLGFFRWLLSRKKQEETIERFKSIQSITQSDLNQFNQSSINRSIKYPIFKDVSQFKIQEEIQEPSPPIELQKESLQLGVAAGYTGRALKEIESSLARIESQIVTKDWFLSQFEDRTPELIDFMKKHEENEQKRFEIMQSILNSLQKTAEKTPEPVRTELLTQIRTAERQLPITHKMSKLLSIVEELKEISYTELSNKLGITESALRGLLSLTLRRTDKIERFKKFGKGWVRFKSD